MQLTAVFLEVPGGYAAFIEELPGSNTQGATMEEARANLEDAVASVLEANRELAARSLEGRTVTRVPFFLPARAPEVVERIIEILRSVRQRKAMYLVDPSVASAENFLNGFGVGCFACGFDEADLPRKQVTVERGWEWSAARPIAEMGGRGLSEEEIVDELIAIEIAVWERYQEGRT